MFHYMNYSLRPIIEQMSFVANQLASLGNQLRLNAGSVAAAQMLAAAKMNTPTLRSPGELARQATSELRYLAESLQSNLLSTTLLTYGFRNLEMIDSEDSREVLKLKSELAELRRKDAEQQRRLQRREKEIDVVELECAELYKKVEYWFG